MQIEHPMTVVGLRVGLGYEWHFAAFRALHPVYIIFLPQVDLVHEITFRSLSEEIGREWETLATYLGVGEKRIEHIKYDNPNNIKQQIYRMLLKWKSMCDDFGSSSFHFLADNLDRVERKPLAAQLRGDFK